MAESKSSDDPVGDIVRAFENPNEIERISPVPDTASPNEYDMKLIRYIERALKHGCAMDEVRKELLKGGHNPDKLERHITHVLERQKSVPRKGWFQAMIVVFALLTCAAMVYIYYQTVM